MTDTRRRVKLYALNSDRQWDDKGTGHVSSTYVERLKGISLLVRAESDGSLLLESKIQTDTAYQKQQETLIVWSEGDNFDLALSFQEKAGCDEIWEKICSVQGKDPSVEFTQEIVEESEDERCFDDMMTGSDSVPPIELPGADMGRLEEISELVTSCLPSPIRREKLAVAIEGEGYIKKLLNVFRMAEDLENTEGLHHLYEIFKNIFLLNKNALFELMFAEDTIFDVVGCLEYDPALAAPKRHRQYLRSIANFHQVIKINNAELLSKIHQTYRVQYIQDVVLPTPSVFEENMLSTLSSFIFFNKVEIVSLIQEDDKFLTELFSQLTDEKTDELTRRESVLFLKEFCTFSQTLQPQSRESFFKTLHNLGVLPALEITLASENRQTKSASIDILLFIVDFSPTMVREHMLQQLNNTEDAFVKWSRGVGRSLSTVDTPLLSSILSRPVPLCDEIVKDSLLMNVIIEQMICDSDPEMGGAVQLMGIIRTLLDPENMLASVNKSEKTDFLNYFYKHCMHVFIAPLIANTHPSAAISASSNSGAESPDSGNAPGSGDDQQQPQEGAGSGGKDGGGGSEAKKKLSMDPCTVQLLSLILELLSFCVEHHTYHIKNYILHKDLLRRILVLMNSRHTFLVLCALRFMRKIIALKDEFYNRYIIKGNLFAPVVDAFVSNNGRYNLLDSAILEMFEFIKLEDIKSLCSHVVENYGQILDKITYVQTFKALKLRYDQHQDRLRDPQTGGGRMAGGGGGQLESVGSILRPGRFKRDPREMDEDEEMWFNDDEFDGDNNASNGSNGGGDNAQEDETDAGATASVPTSSAATAAVATVVENQQVNGLVGSKLDVADEFMNDPSEVGSRGGKDEADESSGDAASAPNAKKGLVDYDSDEEDSDDCNSASEAAASTAATTSPAGAAEGQSKAADEAPSENSQPDAASNSAASNTDDTTKTKKDEEEVDSSKEGDAASAAAEDDEDAKAEAARALLASASSTPPADDGGDATTTARTEAAAETDAKTATEDGKATPVAAGASDEEMPAAKRPRTE